MSVTSLFGCTFSDNNFCANYQSRSDPRENWSNGHIHIKIRQNGWSSKMSKFWLSETFWVLYGNMFWIFSYSGAALPVPTSSLIKSRSSSIASPSRHGQALLPPSSSSSPLTKSLTPSPSSTSGGSQLPVPIHSSASLHSSNNQLNSQQTSTSGSNLKPPNIASR